MDVTTLIVSIVLGVLAIISGMFEFLDRIGLPTPLQEKRDLKNKKIVLDTLEEAGLLTNKKQIQQLGDLISFQKNVPSLHSPDALQKIIKKYLVKRDDIIVGLYKETELDYFIDFHSALVSSNDSNILITIMCKQIIESMKKIDNSSMQFDKIAISKYGNPALGLCVALELQKP